MKQELQKAKWLVCLLTGCLASVKIAVAQLSPPVLLSQPTNQLVDYGANVEFSVRLRGPAVGYRWLKNGEGLHDYRNVGGAQSGTLRLIGVALDDAAGYSVVVSNASGVVTSAVATLAVRSFIVFRETFESGGLTNWTPFSRDGGLTLSEEQNHSPNGTRSALLSVSQEKMYHNLGSELTGKVNATFWLYDSTNGVNRTYGELRGYTGAGHGRYGQRGGLHQLLAIGRYDADFGSSTGTLRSETTNSMKYQGRVLRGASAGWFNLDAPGAPDRSEGWHKFEIKRSADGQTVSFYVDGVVGKTVTGVAHYPLDCVTIGSAVAGNNIGQTWFDDITVEASPRKYDWLSKDSSGRGLFDWMKLRETGTNALVVDNLEATTVLELAGYQVNGSLGSWERDGDAIRARETRGFVEYVVNAPTDDAYRIQIEGREQDSKYPLVELPMLVSIDNEFLGRFRLPYGRGTNGFAHCFTPFIRSGLHTIRIYWDNTLPRCSLRVEALRLQKLEGSDLNGNRYTDWVENRIYAQSRTEVAPERSAVSPVCLEGRGQYLSLMSVMAGTPVPDLAYPVKLGAGHRWYADVPLSPEAVTIVEISHQNGVLVETKQIVWEETNLLEANDLTIRQGDSLRLTAVPVEALEGLARIAIVGLTNYQTEAGAAVVHQFDRPGEFIVRGTFVPTGAMRSIRVKVVGATLDDVVATWANKQRYWDCTNLPPAVMLEADPRLKLGRGENEDQIKTARQLSLVNDEAETRGIVARLGRDGPILASTRVEGFRLSGGMETYLRQLGRYPDGSDMIEAMLILSPVLPDITVDLQVLVSGVTFDDGTVTRTLTASDFDALGICRVRFIRAAGVITSVCHTTKVYQNGKLIGRPGDHK